MFCVCAVLSSVQDCSDHAALLVWFAVGWHCLQLTSSDTGIVAKHKVVHEVTICRNTVPKLLMRSYDKHSKGDDDRRPTQPPGLRGG